MTQDYKDTLLRYLTGNLNEQTGDNKPQFNEEISSESNIGFYISDIDHAGNGATVIDILQCYQSSYSFIYGNTHSGKGFIVILDENNEPIQYIDSYTSGTEFGEFQILNIDESGYVYGIDINNSTPRFIMLNNITLKMPSQQEFSVRLRQSYNLPSPLSTATSYFGIAKAVGQGKYLFGYTVKSNNYDRPRATELTINVGSTNDWVTYAKVTDRGENFIGRSMWASWDEDTVDFKLDGYCIWFNGLHLESYYPNGNDTDLDYLDYEIQSYLTTGFSNGYYSINTLSVNKSVTYVGIYDGGEDGTKETVHLLSCTYKDNLWTVITMKTYNTGPIGPTMQPEIRVRFKLLNGVGYFMATNIDFDLKAHIHTGIITLRTLGTAEIGVVYDTEIINASYDDFRFYMANLYNLYNYNIIDLSFQSSSVGGTNYLVQQVYNASNYNGLPYEANNSLVPNSAIVYGTDKILLARNLYNKTIYGNTTMSSLQIPNVVLNGITMDSQSLLSETNKTLNENEEDITKNIYETLYINFYNTLLIQNQNTEEHISNLSGSSRLNSSVSLNEDYDNAKITKYRVWYIDNTYEDHPVQATIENGVATFVMYVYTREYVTKVDLMSNDGITVYQTITGIMEDDGNGFVTLGKLYKLTQECYVE